MSFIKGKSILGVVLCSVICVAIVGQNENFDKHINVAMRTVGYEILEDAGDSTSLVLPIERNDNNYVISLSSDFSFITDSLMFSIDSIFLQAKIAKHYIVEIKTCDSLHVVYSYEFNQVKLPKDLDLVNSSINMAMMPCKGRDYPVGCYQVHITILEYFDGANIEVLTSPNKVYTSASEKMSYTWAFTFVAVIVLLIILFFYYKNKRVQVIDENLLKIGGHIFDIRNAKLTYNDTDVDLTHKESELLLLLHQAVNTIVEKEVILKEVWGDEGDYVGRTLDVFISKLRKKLESDPLVKIINVRGVGYKLVVN